MNQQLARWRDLDAILWEQDCGACILLRISCGVDSDGQRKILTAVADFQRVTHEDIATADPLARERLHFLRNTRQFCKIRLLERTIVRADKIVPRLSEKHSAGGKLSREIRNDDQRDVQR